MDKVLVFAKKLLKEKIDKNSIVIDATAGNGHDTLFLAKSAAKQVYAFDVQDIAIENTKKLLEENDLLNKVQVIKDGHQNFDDYVNEKIRAVVFNLGYLPNADHSITTLGQTTKLALEKMLKVLEVGGIIVMVVYWGHENGKLEKNIIEEYTSELDQKYYQVLSYRFINQINNAPFILAVEKIKEMN
ncbi:MAG: class I SAM-dependent methyltransferase [Gemella sp.]|nr:class I SAM-dependent methyltransferase [Gemella sp.]